MNKLNELFSSIINKVNASVKTEAQNLTESQKAQARENIGVKAIIDVTELPTENIREDVFYRVVSGTFVYNRFTENSYKVYSVNTLPETGETVLEGTLGSEDSKVTAYYNGEDGIPYGYVDTAIGTAFGIPAGWYPIEMLFATAGVGYGGVITNILDDPMDSTFRLLLEYVTYEYKNGNWTSHKSIGRAGTGVSAEVFNHPSNIASGLASHAEGFYTTASGDHSHAEGYFTTAAEHGQHVQGRNNIIDYDGRYAHIVGNGQGESPNFASNAHTLDWDGLGWYAGGLKVGGTGQDDPNAKEVALKEDIAQIAPVQSVNGKTGEVQLSAADVNARPNTWMPTAQDVGALPNTTVIPTVPTNVSAFNNDAGYLTEHQSLEGLATETYVNTQIAAIPTPDVSGQINTHNTATDSHNDIRLLIEGLTTRLNALANSDDTTLDQMSEIVAYIKNNKSLIEGITTNKVNVDDIINNLTTNVTNKPLSAAQGVALKALIDDIVVPTKVSELTNDKGYLTSFTETDPTVPAWAKQPSKPNYTAAEVGALPSTTKIPSKTSELTNDSGFVTDAVRYVEQTLTESQKAQARENIGAMASDGGSSDIPDYWQEHIDSKIATIKALQDAGGKDCFSYVVMTDMHYPSNLGKKSPLLARHIMDKVGAKFALVLGDVRTRGLKNTKEECETEWADVMEMLEPISNRMLLTQGNHDAGFGSGDYDGDGDSDKYAYEFTPAEMFERVYRKAQAAGEIHYDNSGTAYYIDDVSNKVRYILLNTHLNFDGNAGYDSYETVNGMAKYPSMWIYRYTQCQYDFLTEDALATVPGDDWSVIMGSHVPINQSGEMPEFPVMIGVLTAFVNKTTYTGEYAGTAGGGSGVTENFTNLADPTSSEFLDGHYMNASDHQIGSNSAYAVTNLIPAVCPSKKADIIRFKGYDPGTAVTAAFYKADKTLINMVASTTYNDITFDENGVGTWKAGYVNNYISTADSNALAFVRISGKKLTTAEDIVVTVNEEITYSENSNTTLVPNFIDLCEETSSDFLTGQRIESGGTQVPADSEYCISNYISAKFDKANPDVLRIKGLVVNSSLRVFMCNSNKEPLGSGSGWHSYDGYLNDFTIDDDGVISWNVGNCDNYMSTSTHGAIAFVRFTGLRESTDTDVIATINKEITYTETEGPGEEEQLPGYDAVSVNCDFTNAKGNLISYHGGHLHVDTADTNCYQGGALPFPIITTRCDAKEENTTDLKAERIAGTTTEQSFDVFTVNTKEHKIYATKIGAGADRVIAYSESAKGNEKNPCETITEEYINSLIDAKLGGD